MGCCGGKEAAEQEEDFTDLEKKGGPGEQSPKKPGGKQPSKYVERDIAVPRQPLVERPEYVCGPVLIGGGAPPPPQANSRPATSAPRQQQQQEDRGVKNIGATTLPEESAADKAEKDKVRDEVANPKPIEITFDDDEMEEVPPADAQEDIENFNAEAEQVELIGEEQPPHKTAPDDIFPRESWFRERGVEAPNVMWSQTDEDLLLCINPASASSGYEVSKDGACVHFNSEGDKGEQYRVSLFLSSPLRKWEWRLDDTCLTLEAKKKTPARWRQLIQGPAAEYLGLTWIVKDLSNEEEDEEA